MVRASNSGAKNPEVGSQFSANGSVPIVVQYLGRKVAQACTVGPVVSTNLLRRAIPGGDTQSYFSNERVLIDTRRNSWKPLKK